MWSFLVVMATPDPTDVIKMFFGHDYELVEALKLQRLDKSCHMGSQVRRHRGVSFHLRPAGFQHFIKLSRILRIVVSHHIFRCEAHVLCDHQKVSGLQADPCGIWLHGTR